MESLEVVVAELVDARGRQPEARPDALDQRRLEAGLVGQITRTRIEDNALYGIYVLGGVMLSIEDSAITGSANNVDVSPNAFSAQPQVTIARSLLSGGNYGVFAGPTAGLATAYVTIMDSTISKAALAGIAAVQSSGPPAAVAMPAALACPPPPPGTPSPPRSWGGSCGG